MTEREKENENTKVPRDSDRPIAPAEWKAMMETVKKME